MRTVPSWLTLFAILLASWAVPLPRAQAGREDVPPPPPALAAISPSTVAAGSPDFTLTVNGSNFVAGTVVSWSNTVRSTTYLSATRLTAAISSADVTSVGTFSVTVSGETSPLTLTVYTRLGHDATADTVQGQPNFTVNDTNNPHMPAANQLDQPYGLAADAHTGRLYVADTNNNRVLSWPNAAARANGQAADLVIGQPNFISHTANTNGISANSLNFPTGVALDAPGNLYVADGGNNRVLEYTAPLTNGMAANGVFGQGGSFTTTAVLPVTAASLNGPYGVALDAQGGQGHLYVTDNNNSRVLEFDTPLTSTTADRVFGQSGSFTTHTANQGGLGPASLNFPTGVALDAQGHLYVADWTNHRVLEYTTPLTSTTADHVFGQPNFLSNNYNISGIVTPTAASLYFPLGVALDALGNLYVADSFNIRVLEYDTPLTTDTIADRVFGQGGSFTTRAVLPVSATSLLGPAGVALDGPGNLYVADQLNNRVLEYDAHAPLQVFLPLVRR